MRRRAFCGAALAGAALTGIPFERLFGALVSGPPSEPLPALSNAGKQIALPVADVADLGQALRGPLLWPGQDGYDAARHVWNGAFDREPALIARCAGAADVMQAVDFGRGFDLPVAVRGGGHSLSGQSVCEGGLMIDLSPMRSVRVDPEAMTARAEPGVLLHALDAETQSFGLATPAGTVSHTGIAGLTLGGGFGRIARKYGLTCDHLQAADVIDAHGKLVQANEAENAGLLWGLRGGGGNFGVVTSFEYRLHRVQTTMLGGPIIYPLPQAREVLGFFADFALEAPDEINMDAALASGPDGQKVLVIDVCYCGDHAEGERVLAPLRAFRKPVMDGVRPTPYVALQQSHDAMFPVGRKYYVKGAFLHRIEPGLLDVTLEHLQTAPPGASFVFVHHGGAIGRVKPEATAFWHREARHTVLLQNGWDDPALSEQNVAWARAVWPDIEPYTKGFYVNLSGGESGERVRHNYGDNYARLQNLKDRYDPGNLFHLNANVVPDA
ncbi:MAG TPA: FAD-binding oxidoreductase [Woeseiaceae bacterium]|nr:FAD-binding oxidoreductase [Woeseiaceae bacterium]